MRYFFLTVAFIAFLFPAYTHAATLRVAPVSASTQSGSTVSVSVQVSSSDQALNAVSGVLKFPPELLQVTSISKSGSVIGLWVQEPSHSNVAGTVNFEGVVLNPGYQGSNGTIVTVTFRALVAGVASLSVQSGSVLANDGNGTEILAGVSGGSISISEGAAPAPKPTPSFVSATGKRLVVTSSTHPDSSKAYRAPVVRLEWENPDGTEAVRVLYDKYPETTPGVVYDVPIESKEITPGKGTWYFHAQARTDAGWGPAAHFKFTIDPNALEETASTTNKNLLDISVAIAKEGTPSSWERVKALAMSVLRFLMSQWPSMLVAVIAYAFIRVRRPRRQSARCF